MPKPVYAPKKKVTKKVVKKKTPTTSLPPWAGNGLLDSFQGLMLKTTSPPEDWLDPQANPTSSKGSLDPLPCDNYVTLRRAWQSAMQWTFNMDASLITLLACGASTMQQGSQVWIRLIGAPSSGKSTLCEAMAVSWRHTYSVSIQKGFHSGWKESNDSEQKDASLATKAHGRTLLTKDGDTLISSPSREQILGEARDLYDGTSRATYRNNITHNYEGHRMTWVLAGTPSLRKLNKSFLGDRFLDCIVFESKQEGGRDIKMQILKRALKKAKERVKLTVDDSPESRQDPAMTKAMALTGGYLDYLRDNAATLLQEVHCSEEMEDTIGELACIVAFMRARPDKELEYEDPEPELASRLAEQMMRLGHLIALVLNKQEIDNEVLFILRKITRDTSRGVNQIYAKEFFERYPTALSAKHFEGRLGVSLNTARRQLDFMRSIEMLKKYKKPNNSGAKGRNTHMYALHPEVRPILKHLFE